MIESSKVSLEGLMGLIPKGKFILIPLIEAVTNSLEAISEKTYIAGEHPEINISFYFTGLLNETKELNSVIVEDNGVGFNAESFERYENLLDKSKGFNNRGSGRIQFLHSFNKIKIESTYAQDEQNWLISFSSDSKNLVYDKKDPVVSTKSQTGTQIHMVGYKQTKSHYFDHLTANEVKNELNRKFLLKLYLEKKKEDFNPPTINIFFYKNDKLSDKSSINVSEIPEPKDSGELEVKYVKATTSIHGDVEWATLDKKEVLKWAHFKLQDDKLDSNGVCLCSKDVPIQNLPLPKIKKSESVEGYRHLTVIYGDVLDRPNNVSDSVDKFLFPTQKEIEKEIANGDADLEEDYFLIDNIEKGVKVALSHIYDDVEIIKTKQNDRVTEIAKAHGISEAIAKSISIDLSDNEEKITEKLFKKQGEENGKKSLQIKKLYETLNELNPTSENYLSDLEEKGKELLKLIPQQDKEELSRYVIRREMVTKILSLILKNDLHYQKTPKEDGKNKDKEGLIHDLVFKRKKEQNDGLNDLWILNEEFLHFEGCSDIPLNEIKDAKGMPLLKPFSSEEELLSQFKVNKSVRRPDIFLFMEEGKCVLIEFKAVDVDLSDHLNQLTKYCNMIANYSIDKIEQFYCYLIGENIDVRDLPGEFVKSITGDFVKVTQPIRSIEVGKEEFSIGNIYQEVIQLSSIARRANVRNQSFAGKLGIRLPNS